MFDANPNCGQPTVASASTSRITAPPFKVVSFFSGCGGMDLGFLGGFTCKTELLARRHFNIIAAYDNDPQCQKTYTTNIGAHFHLVDLANVDIESIPRADLLIGGFPCQEFSSCGPRKGLAVKRGRLYEAMVRYAAEKRPKIIVAENVVNLVRLNKGRDFQKICTAFREEGYKLKTLDMMAADYGVPQLRHRVFLICVRKDIRGFPVAPTPEFSSTHRGIGWAIDDLVNVSDESVHNQSQYFRAAKATTGHGQGDEKSVFDMPAFTVRANAKSRIQFHYSLNRRLTVRECARIQTFPDNFRFDHGATTNMAQIGNAVPPALAHRIACSIEEFLLNRYEHRQNTRKR